MLHKLTFVVNFKDETKVELKQLFGLFRRELVGRNLLVDVDGKVYLTTSHLDDAAMRWLYDEGVLESTS